MKELVEKLAAEQEERLLADYKHLHAHPELSFEEYETQKWIQAQLAELNIPIVEGITGTSTVAVLEGEQEGPTIMFRADIDALPVDEENELPWKSTVPGVMHACGHDTHNATLMSFVRTMAAHRELIKGKIKFVFQAAEEKLPGGATQLVKDGVMEDVDFGFGLHAAGGIELGKVNISSGPISAAVAVWEIKVVGRGGHGSREDLSINPIPIACAIGSAINQVNVETLSPFDSCTINMGYFNAGQLPNVIPGECTLGGNVRILNNDMMQPVLDRMKSVAEGIAAGWGASIEWFQEIGYPANMSDPELAKIAWDACEEIGLEPFATEASMGAEDFAYYTLEKPCTFLHVGGKVPEDGHETHHNKNFQLDTGLLMNQLKSEIAFYLKATGQA